MKFKNETGEDIHMRMTSNKAGDIFINLKNGEEIDLPEEFGKKSGLTLMEDKK